MKIKLEFEDNNAFTAKEVEQTLKNSYGKNAKIQVLPHNNSPESYIYFGIQNLITLEQLELFYEFYPHLYKEKREDLKIQFMKKIEKIFDRVISDNEKRVLE